MLVDAIYTGRVVGTKIYQFHGGDPMFFSMVSPRRTVELSFFRRMEEEWQHDFFAVPVNYEVPPLSTPMIHLTTINDYNKEILLGMDLDTVGRVLAARRYVEEVIGKPGYYVTHFEVFRRGPFKFEEA